MKNKGKEKIKLDGRLTRIENKKVIIKVELKGKRIEKLQKINIITISNKNIKQIYPAIKEYETRSYVRIRKDIKFDQGTYQIKIRCEYNDNKIEEIKLTSSQILNFKIKNNITVRTRENQEIVIDSSKYNFPKVEAIDGKLSRISINKESTIIKAEITGENLDKLHEIYFLSITPDKINHIYPVVVEVMTESYVRICLETKFQKGDYKIKLVAKYRNKIYIEEYLKSSAHLNSIKSSNTLLKINNNNQIIVKSRKKYQPIIKNTDAKLSRIDSSGNVIVKIEITGENLNNLNNLVLVSEGKKQEIFNPIAIEMDTNNYIRIRYVIDYIIGKNKFKLEYECDNCSFFTEEIKSVKRLNYKGYKNGEILKLNTKWDKTLKFNKLSKKKYLIKLLFVLILIIMCFVIKL